MNAQRVGVNFNYDFAPEWQLRTMVFDETDTLRTHDVQGKYVKLENSNTRWAYTLMLRRSF